MMTLEIASPFPHSHEEFNIKPRVSICSQHCIVATTHSHQHTRPQPIPKRCQCWLQRLCEMRSQSSPSPSLRFPKSKHADLTSSSAVHNAFSIRFHLSIFLCITQIFGEVDHTPISKPSRAGGRSSNVVVSRTHRPPRASS